MEKTDEILEALVKSIEFGKLAIILSLGTLKFTRMLNEKQLIFLKDFYINCLKLKDYEITYFTIINIVDYFKRMPEGIEELYDYVCSIKTNNVFLNNSIIEIHEIMGNMDCDNSEDIEKLVQAVQSASKNKDYKVGKTLASLYFEGLKYFREQPIKVREIIGDDTFKEILLFSLDDPEVDEWGIDNVLVMLYKYNDSNVIKAFSRFCFFEREHYQHNGKWGGVRATALNGLLTNVNEEKLYTLIHLFKNSSDYEYRLFFLSGIWILLNERSEINNAKDSECLQIQMSNFFENNSRYCDVESIIKAAVELHLGHWHIYMESFENIFKSIINSFSKEAVFEICFKYIENDEFDSSRHRFVISELKSNAYKFIFSIIRFLGNKYDLDKLYRLHEKCPEYSGEISYIISDWANRV